MGLFPPSAGGGQEVSHGYKGKGSLIHLLVDGNGQPLAATTTSASGDERKEVEKLIDKVSLPSSSKSFEGMIILEADRGYDCGWLRQALLNRNIFPLIPYRKIRGRNAPSFAEVTGTFSLKGKRWQIERAFSWLKRRCRRLLNRWERLPVVWSGFVTLGLIYTWLKNLLG